MDEAEPPGERVRLEGFRETVGPLGEAVAPSATPPVNPLRLVKVMVDVPDDPCKMESEEGEAETPKSGPFVIV